MFLFQISSYDHPALDAETAELLRQRLEAHSRRTAPGIWRASDRLNAHAERGPGREKRRTRYRVYGVLLVALGVFALVPGLAPPGTPILIVAGAFAILSGLLNFSLVREKAPRKPPARCRKEAQKLLAGRRAADWSEAQAQVRLDEAGVTLLSGEGQELVPYDKITGVFETDHLWLLTYEGEKALLLQKKDLTSGDAGEFVPYLRPKIGIQPL